MSYTDVENVYREFITEAKKLHDEIMKLFLHVLIQHTRNNHESAARSCHY